MTALTIQECRFLKQFKLSIEERRLIDTILETKSIQIANKSERRKMHMGHDTMRSLLAGIGLAGLMASVALLSPGTTYGASG